MKLLTCETNLKVTLEIAKTLEGSYSNDILFHAFWNGNLNEKHYISILSCYYTNIKNYSNRKIILWIENTPKNQWYDKISKYAEIREFKLEDEKVSTPILGKSFYYNKSLSFYSDVVRYILLYKYGGCWFDLDILFLRDFSPIFQDYKTECVVYQWENQNYPNGAIYVSVTPKNEILKEVIEFIITRNKGWGFQEANLTYNLPLRLTVLPCSWFDPSWVDDNLKTCDLLFKKSQDPVNLKTFYQGAFCFHWHNRWGHKIEENSVIYQLLHIISDGDYKTTETH
jgi:hypothetical protein